MKLICKQCGKTGDLKKPYCPFHGKMIEWTSEEFFPPYNETYGLWKVTTEGNCEGKLIKVLGIHEGHIDEIAKSLSGSCYYSLHFERLKKTIQKESNTAPEKDSANVSIMIPGLSNINGKNKETEYKKIEKLFENRPVKIKPSSYYNTFTIVFDNKQKIIDEKA